MSPDFLPGDFIIVWRHPWMRWRVGEDVVLQHPRYGLIVKRIATCDGEHCTLTGLHPNSVSSYALGRQPLRSILGKILLPVRQPR